MYVYVYTDADDDVDECICNQFPFLNWRLPPLRPVGSNDNETLYLLMVYDGEEAFDDDGDGDDDQD